MCNLPKKEFRSLSVADMEQIIAEVFLELTGVEHQIFVDEFTLRKARGGAEALKFSVNIGENKRW